MNPNNIVGSRYIRLSSRKARQINSQPTDDFSIKLPSLLSTKNEVITSYNQITRQDQVSNIKFFEVALTYLRCVRSWHNISNRLSNNSFEYSTDNGNSFTKITFPDGNYDYNDLINHITNELAKNDDESAFHLEANYSTLKSNLTLDTNTIIRFTNNFGKVLGFTQNEYLINSTSEQKINIDKIEEVLVHCDIVDGSSNNNDKSQIIYTFNPCSSSNGIIQFHIDSPIYLPIISDSISTIRIKLTDQDGDRIDFNDEDVTVMLHIRKNMY